MPAQPTAPSAAETPARLAFYERISQKHLTPLWRSLSSLVTPEPVSGCQPAAWPFADIRAAMIEAGSLITAKEAERRVLKPASFVIDELLVHHVAKHQGQIRRNLTQFTEARAQA